MPLVRFALRAVLVLAGGIAFAPLSAAPGPVHLFHANPEGYGFEGSMPEPAGTYFALHCAARCELRRNRVTIRKQTIETHDGPVPGVFARARKAAPSLFLVRGIPGLKEGPVTTWYYNAGFQRGALDQDRRWETSRMRRFDIGGKPLTIAGLYSNTKDSVCAADPVCEGAMRIEWKVRFGEVERTLAVAETETPELGTPLTIDDVVVWIGDLDGDAKPDLVLRPQSRGDYLHLQLFLSRDLGSGKPWRPAAQFYYWDPNNAGC